MPRAWRRTAALRVLVAAALGCLILLITPADGAAQQAAEGLPDPPDVLISPRRTAAFAAAIISGLLLLQYGHRRQRHILLWALGYLLIAPAMLLIAEGYGSVRIGALAVGASQLLGVCTAGLFFWSADFYRRTGLVRPARLKLLAPVAPWFLAAPVLFGMRTVLAPAYLPAGALLPPPASCTGRSWSSGASSARG